MWEGNFGFSKILCNQTDPEILVLMFYIARFLQRLKSHLIGEEGEDEHKKSVPIVARFFVSV